MHSLLFAIPTWNRAAHLERCVRSIASQVQLGMDTHILIGDDASTDDTPRVISALMAEFPFVTSYRNPLRTDYADAFHTLFTHSTVEGSEWVWTFGDDDTLEPGALTYIREEFAKADETCFFHVAEATRASPKPAAYSGTLFDLACNFGWIEMTGFITGNITRGPLLHAAGSSTLWRSYARTAFAQSCALLEALHDKPALFLDSPLVRTQENAQSQDTIDRWGADNIAVRYTYLSGAIQLMYEQGILTSKVPRKFFRYLVYHLWDRHLTFMVQDYMDRRQMWPAEAWARVKLFADFLADEEEATKLRQDIDVCQGIITAHAFGNQALDQMLLQANRTALARNAEVYPYGYVEAGTGRPLVAGEPTKPQP